VACFGDRKGAYRFSVGRPHRKRTLGRFRRNWDVNIKIDIQEVGWIGMDFIVVVQDSDRWHGLVIAVINHRDT